MTTGKQPRPPYTDEEYERILSTLDDEERETLEAVESALEAGRLSSAPDAAERKREAQTMARETLKHLGKQKKTVRITMRMNPTDLEKIKGKAAEEGLPYQTLISSLLHKYVTGKLVEK